MRWAAAGGLSLLTLGAAAPLTLAGPAMAGASTTHHTVMVKKETNHSVGGTILVTPSGFTLYRLTTDKHNHPTCTGGCATVWPPLVLPQGDKKAAGTGVNGLGEVKLADGKWQVTYHGMPLYRYSGDTTAGSTNGQGVGGVWFVVHPAKATSAASTQSTTGSSGSGSGGSGSGSGYGGY